MSFYDFSKNEIERLTQIQSKLKFQFENLYKIHHNHIENEKVQEKINEFIDSTNTYNERFDIYKYQIFILVTAENWEERLDSWVENICPNSETLYHQYYQLYSLYAWICCIIPFSQRTVSHRIRNAILETFGYEEGISKIKILIVDEMDEQIKSDLELFIQDDCEISDYKSVMLEVIQSEKPFNDLDNLTQKLRSENWLPTDITNFLSKFRVFISYHSQTKHDDSLNDTLNDYIERHEN